MRRRPPVPQTPVESEPSFRDEVEAFRREPPKEKLKIIGAGLLLLPILALVFLAGFFLFGGWALFDDHLPAWVERLFTGLVIVLIAWGLFRPLLDRIEGRDARRPPR
jgi:Putative Actinobacterial Holin-X, holin superfamily III